MRDGFLRVAAAVPAVSPANVEQNVDNIIELARTLHAERGVEVAVFPEMCITGYTCADLFHNDLLLEAASRGLRRLVDFSTTIPMAMIVGLPMVEDGAVYNIAALIEGGERLTVKKTYVPEYNEFYERRWWRPAPLMSDEVGLFTTHGVTIGIEICEDLWAPIPPSSRLALSGAKVIFNLSASDDLIGKYRYLRSLVEGQSARCLCGYVYAGAGYGESSTDLTFDGKGLIAENGRILAEKPRWSTADRYVVADIDIMAIDRDRRHYTTFADCAEREGCLSAAEPVALCPYQPSAEFPRPLYRHIDRHPFVPADDSARSQRCAEIINIQAAALCRRLDAIGCRNLVVGISGGLDSTLALMVAVKAFDRLGLDRRGIHAITMPGFGTTSRTHDNATLLMQSLGVSIREISIVPAVEQHFRDIGHDATVRDVTYENAQARQRTYLLMDIANQVGGIVLGTGDLSELALGWATYNGDQMSMYGVNAGIPKTLVRYLVSHFASEAADDTTRRVLLDIVDTPISPELIPADADDHITQKTEDLVGPYELHDFYLYYLLRYGFAPRRVYHLACEAFRGSEYTPEVILKWMRVFYRRFFSQQFKRSCMPDGPKVGSVCLSPRGDWRMPSDASSALWIAEVDAMIAENEALKC